MEYLIFWIALAFIVGVAANTRGRNGFGWFVLAVVLSPLIAGLLVLALPRLQDSSSSTSAGEPIVSGELHEPNPSSPPAMAPAFEPDGVYAGIPYKVVELGAVMALLSGGLVRFRDMNQFLAAANGQTTEPVAR